LVSNLCDVISDYVGFESRFHCKKRVGERTQYVPVMSLLSVGLGSDLTARYPWATPGLILSVIT
jgi:hypothetical protein